MSLYVFDTDVLTLWRYRNANVLRQIAAHSADDLGVHVIAAQEALDGWLKEIKRQTRPDRLAVAFAELAETVRFLGQHTIIPYAESTMLLFQQLRGQASNVGANDLRIAAVAIENGGIVVTRNARDFRRIPGVAFEDWSV